MVNFPAAFVVIPEADPISRSQEKHIVWFQNVPKMCKDALLNHGDSGVFFIGMRGRYEGILGASKPFFDW